MSQNPPSYAVYGTLPVWWPTPPVDVQQYDPLLPHSADFSSCAEGSLVSVWIAAPQGTLERRYAFALALRALKKGGELVALAPKDKGGSRMAKELTALGCAVTQEARHHYKIITTCRPDAPIGLPETLAEGAMREDPALGLWTQPGIFSWDRVDQGSALLLAHLPSLGGHGADLGCGLGVLSRAVLAASPRVTSLTLVDCDGRAMRAAARNVTDPRATFLWADALTADIPVASLDFVVMNPPFHAQGLEDHALGQAFLARAAALLKTGGVCWLTANRHLPYESTLHAAFRTVTRVAEADGFKIYRAEK